MPDRMVIMKVEYGKESISVLGQQLIELLVRTQTTRNLTFPTTKAVRVQSAPELPR